jgi:hypothetical protein
VEKNCDWTIIGGATIILRCRNEKKYQDRPTFFFYPGMALCVNLGSKC